MIRQNKNIKGIYIGETESKISQCADDTEITLESDKNSFEETVKTINTFGKNIRTLPKCGEDQCHMAG